MANQEANKGVYQSRRHPWMEFLAHLLFFVAAWTLFIKYLFPLSYAMVYGEPLTRHIYWDLWPAAHIWLGWTLLVQARHAKWLAVSMAVVEIAIITTLLEAFLADPEWTIWRCNWFVNKVFVLGTFVLVLATALARPAWFAPGASIDINSAREAES